MPLHDILHNELAKDYGEFPVFGSLIYSDQDNNGHLEAVLNIPTYFNRLDIVTGPRWKVYIIKLRSSVSTASAHICNDGFGLITSLDPYLLAQPDPFQNEWLMQWFGIRNHGDLPCLVVFTVDQENGELLSVKQAITGDTLESTFNCLIAYMKDICQVMSHIQIEYLGNRREIYTLIKNYLANKNQVDVIKRLIPIKNVFELVKFFTKAFGITV